MLVSIYLIYIVFTLGVTIWVGKVLKRSGRYFLIDAFNKNETLAESVNDLLIVGFYLINVGYVCVALEADRVPNSWADVIVILSSKIGIVLLVLGSLHFMNIVILSKFKNKN